MLKKLILIPIVCFASFYLLNGQTQITGSLFSGGLNRNYRAYLPPGFTPASNAPLVINMHGYSSNAAQQELYSGMNAVADTAGFVVCYPDGVNNAWNVGFFGNYHSGVDDVAFIKALIDQLYFQYQIDRSRVYACGMSNGGFMSYRLACELDDKIAAIASVTGAMNDSIAHYCSPLRKMPVMQVHGTADGVVPYNGTPGGHWSIPNSVDFWVNYDNCTFPSLDTFPNINTTDNSTANSQHWTNCAPNSEVLFLKVENGGHTWPGAFPVPSLGNTNMDIHCSREIWEFFLGFSHPNPATSTIEELSEIDGPMVFPNPARESVQLSWQNHQGHCEIFRMDGVQVFSGTFHHQLRVGNLPAGTYLAHITDGANAQNLRFTLLD